jgi:regulator of cell morphogenesis and NO signaling
MIPETHLLLRAFARAPLDRVAIPPAVAPQTPPAEIGELIAFILERYHQTHRRELPEAIRLARKVEALHAQSADCPTGLADHLAMIADDLESHQQKEEKVLFPLMTQGGSAAIRFPIDRMMAEHRDVDVQLEQLEALTADFVPPRDACRTWRQLYRLCGKIDADLREHMRLENEVLFARFI